MYPFLENSFVSASIGFIFGAVLGSFINVCAHRIPLGKSIVLPPSSCPHCQNLIPWHQNLPLLTWILQVGKAKCCSFKIPPRYFLVELVTAIIFSFFCYQAASSGTWAMSLVGCIFSFLMITVVVIDLETMTIPDRFSIGGALLGLILSTLIPSIHSLEGTGTEMRMSSFFTSITGLLIGSSILYWIGAIGYRIFGREALGEGDVKLLGCIGAFCGWKGAVFSIFGGAMLGCLLMLPLMAYGKIRNFYGNRAGNNQNLQWGQEIPFGPYLACAALLYWVGLDALAEDWFLFKMIPLIENISY